MARSKHVARRPGKPRAMPEARNPLPPPPAMTTTTTTTTTMYQFHGATNDTKADAARTSKPPRAFTYRTQPKAHERPLLTSKHEGSEQLTFPAANNTPDKFRNLEEMTNTDESDMEESDVDGDDSDQPPSKRARLDVDAPTPSLAVKWSNPDPYTALPPPSDTTRKKTNVVKLIRKARNAIDKLHEGDDASADGDGFISLDVNGDFAQEDQATTAPANAPTGPKSDRPVTRAPLASVASKKNPDRGAGYYAKDDSKMAGPPDVPAMMRSNGQSAIDHAAREESTAYSGATGDRPTNGDSVLGKRSRKEFEDTRTPRTRYGKQLSDGMITGEWAVADDTDSAPWLDHPQDMSDNPGTALHKEIIDFYEWVRPRDYESAVRANVVARLEDALRRLHPGGQLKAFGSYAAGLYLPTGDMDLVFNEAHFRGRTLSSGYPMKKPLNWLQVVARFLETHQLVKPGTLQVISAARVQIIKFVERVSNLKVDLSFNNNTGVTANETFHRWRAQYPAMPILVSIIKQFLMIRGLNDVSTGGLGGFSTICLVTSLLQHMPFAGQPPDLGQCLVEFFNVYGNLFNREDVAVRLDPPGFINKHTYTPFAYNQDKPDRLSIIDPNRPDNNISGGSSEIQLVFKCFAEAHANLLRRLAEYEDGSDRFAGFLVDLVGGNFTAYDEQRAVLYRLHFGHPLHPPAKTEVQVPTQTRSHLPREEDRRNGTTEWDAPHTVEQAKIIKPRPGVLIFAAENRQTVRAEQPGLSKAQVSQVLTNRWSAMSLEERAPYKAKAEAEKARHKSATAAKATKATQAKKAGACLSKGRKLSIRMRYLRPELAAKIPKKLTVDQALVLSGWSNAAAFKKDLVERESRLNPTQKTALQAALHPT